jgi:hypothetical protein
MKKKQRRALGRPHRLALAKKISTDQKTNRIIDVSFRVKENQLRRFLEILEEGGVELIRAIPE